MSMSKKHYQEIATRFGLQAKRDLTDTSTLNDIANSLASYFQVENPNFNKQRFFDWIEQVRTEPTI